MDPRRRSRHLPTLAIALGLFLAACSAGATPPTGSPPYPTASAPGASGLEGRAPLAGVVVAGPTCPVERIPPDPSCAPRTVVGAHLIVRDRSGSIVATLTTDTHGVFATTLPWGDYTITTVAVAGLMHAPSPQDFVLGPAGLTGLRITFDTGIR